MASNYFDEHNCTPLAEGERPNDLLHLARLLIDGGFMNDLGMDFGSMFGENGKPPPASKKVVEMLPTLKLNEEQKIRGLSCPICLVTFEDGEDIKRLPCDHHFHPRCILVWLNQTNSCPLCRHELPTDDPNYEELKRQKARQKQREFELETLHDSMFG